MYAQICGRQYDLYHYPFLRREWVASSRDATPDCMTCFYANWRKCIDMPHND
jgi:hypothetical protein